MAAASAASGARSWLQCQNISWLTPRRLRGVTVAIMICAGLVSTIGMSGSTAPAHAAVAHHAAPARR